MSKFREPRKPTVALGQSRIRRDPPPAAKPGLPRAYWDPADWETWVVVTGVILFALGLAIIIVGFSDFTSG